MDISKASHQQWLSKNTHNWNSCLVDLLVIPRYSSSIFSCWKLSPVVVWWWHQETNWHHSLHTSCLEFSLTPKLIHNQLANQPAYIIVGCLIDVNCLGFFFKNHSPPLPPKNIHVASPRGQFSKKDRRPQVCQKIKRSVFKVSKGGKKGVRSFPFKKHLLDNMLIEMFRWG